MRPGYKQTELGVFPQEWDTKKLARLSQLAPDTSAKSLIHMAPTP